ncbi:hypothetical protein ANN_15011, partial [Periplaneta americana]
MSVVLKVRIYRLGETDVYHGLLEYSKHRKHFIATMLKIDIDFPKLPSLNRNQDGDFIATNQKFVFQKKIIEICLHKPIDFPSQNLFLDFNVLNTARFVITYRQPTPTIGTTHPHPYHRQLHIAEPKSAVVQETLKTTTNSVETGRLSK